MLRTLLSSNPSLLLRLLLTYLMSHAPRHLFQVPSLTGVAMGCVGVALTVLTEAAMRTAAAPLGCPIGTLPFCAAGLVLLLTHSKIPGAPHPSRYRLPSAPGQQQQNRA